MTTKSQEHQTADHLCALLPTSSPFASPLPYPPAAGPREGWPRAKRGRGRAVQAGKTALHPGPPRTARNAIQRGESHSQRLLFIGSECRKPIWRLALSFRVFESSWSKPLVVARPCRSLYRRFTADPSTPPLSRRLHE
jgi:hypothetical protein